MIQRKNTYKRGRHYAQTAQIFSVCCAARQLFRGRGGKFHRALELFSEKHPDVSVAYGNHEELYPALLRCGNIPSAFAQTASTTLANATLPFAVQLAGKGAEQALADNKHLRRGLTTYAGKLTLLETAKKLEMPFTSPEEAIGM